MKKLLLSVLLVSLSLSTFAQMSENQIIQYVAEQQEKGVSQEQIVYNLSKRGVTIEQLQQIKNSRVSSTQSNSNVEEQSRLRSNISDQKKSSDYVNMTEQDRLAEMQKESLFLFNSSEESQFSTFSSKIFGHDIFNNKNLTFEPSLSVATPQNYKLGPGDEVIVDIWGASQATIRQTISPDGNIMVENIGPVYLNGLTVSDADSYIKKIFSQIYSGLDGDDSNSSIKLSLGQNRSIQVNVMGEVINPGTYVVSSFATIFNALYLAGGMNDIGTMREVKLFRNNKQIASIDIYDFLLNGKIKDDIRLNDNDVIVVSPYRMMVTIDGQIRRPMMYEMKSDESLATLLDYAGGLSSNAYKEDVRVIRKGKVQQEIFTVSAEKQNSFSLLDGDSIFVDSIMSTFSNMASINGAVYRPGMFQIGEEIVSVSQLIKAAGGIREDALKTRALLSRTNPDKTLFNQAIDIDGLLNGTAPDVSLRNDDVLLIPSIFDVHEVQTFSIYGEVLTPGVFQYADNTQIEDLILQAGGLKEAASISKIDVVRRSHDRVSLSSNDVLSETFSFSVDENLIIKDNDFILKPFDEVYVRRSPGYSKSKRVRIDGEILFPGYYSLSTNNERLSDIVKKAGSFTPESYLEGARLERTMTSEEELRTKKMAKMLSSKDSISSLSMDVSSIYYVGIDLKDAMKNPGGESDIIVRDGDRIIIPQFTNTVKINGAVMYSNTVTYLGKENVNYYIDKAGGFSENAKKNKSYIVYMNGTVTKAKRGSSKMVKPGCEIIVPSKQERKGMSTSEILSLSSTSASLATVVLALINLLK